ncbi:hypothetical protein CC2G_008120 [Coprinopsis cinerea AmutBmut pab1-1]|nr:hypothetical protein CC2G_008120 [Coprinopsis cinerea AmutBmut pab1-1]
MMMFIESTTPVSFCSNCKCGNTCGCGNSCGCTKDQANEASCGSSNCACTNCACKADDCKC